MKLSFIVPIYNVKEYLRKCVDSLLAQDYEDYEIVLVDDGSTDGSGELADMLSQRSKVEGLRCIRVIHQKNRGLSGARNTGIEAAKGEYVCFVDSDDYWEENVLAGLMKQVERDQLDVLRFRWQNVRDNGEVFQPYSEENFADFSCGVLNGVDYLNKRMGIQCYAVQFIVRRSLLVDECLFTEGILFEDTDWTPRMLVQAKRAAGTETMVYNYLWRENGITLCKSPDKLRGEVENKIALIGRLNEWGNSDWYKGMISALVVSVVNILSGALYGERRKYLAALEEKKIYPLSMRGLNKKAQRKAKLINISPRLTVWILHLRK